MQTLEMRVSGFGGQGIILSGYIIGKAASIHDGKESTMAQAYGPEARGSACSAQVIISDAPIRYPYVTESDVLGSVVEGLAILASAVAEVMFRNVESVNERDDARRLSDIFAQGLVALVVDDDDRLRGLITKMDLVDVLTKQVEAPAGV